MNSNLKSDKDIEFLYSQFGGSKGEFFISMFMRNNHCQIRKSYKSEKGKAPDWVVLENGSAIIIECKVTGLSQKALATGDMAAIDFSIERLIKGLIQLHEFKDACQKRAAGLELFHGFPNFEMLVATYEPFYIINSAPFKEKINQRLEAKLKPKKINLSDWEILSIGQLEKLQPILPPEYL